MIDIVKPGASIEEKGTSLIIYGDPGSGKTSLVKTLLGWSHDNVKVDLETHKVIADGWGAHKPYCKPEEILVLCADAGDAVLTKEEKYCCSVFHIKDTMENFKELMDFVCARKYPFKVLFVDNISELEKYFVLSLTKKVGLDTPRMKEWGDSSMYLRKYLRQLRDLVFYNIDVIFVFWTMEVPIEDKDGQMQSFIYPMCMRKTKEEYMGLVEHVAYMGISQKNGQRFLQFESAGPYKAKTRSELIKKFEMGANLADILRKLRGR